MSSAPPAPPASEAQNPSAPVRLSGVGKHVLVYGAGIALSRAVSFVMLPIYTNYLTPADYGVIQLIEMTLDVIAILAGGQIAAGIFRYYHAARTEDERRGVVSTALWLLMATYTLVGAATFLAAPAISSVIFGTTEHATLVRLAAGSLALSAFVIAPLAFLRVREQSGTFVVVNAVKLVVALGLNILFLVGMGMGPEGVFLSSLIANLVIGTGLIWLVARQTGMAFSRSASRKLLRYGIPLIATQMATFVTTFGDRYFLQAAADEATVGLYALAYQFGFLLATVGVVPFEMIWDPVRFRIAAQQNRDEVLARGFIYLNVLLITAAVGIAVLAGDVIRVMTGPAFHSAASLVPVILIAYVLQGWAGNQDIGIRIRDRTEFLTVANWAAAAVALVGYALLIPPYHGWGAAAATVIAFAVRYVGIYWISQRLWPVRYRWAPVVRLVGLGLAVSVASLLLPTLPLHQSLPIRFALLTFYAVAVWHADILSERDRARIVEFLVRMRDRVAPARDSVR